MRIVYEVWMDNYTFEVAFESYKMVEKAMKESCNVVDVKDVKGNRYLLNTSRIVGVTAQNKEE